MIVLGACVLSCSTAFVLSRPCVHLGSLQLASLSEVVRLAYIFG